MIYFTDTVMRNLQIYINYKLHNYKYSKSAAEKAEANVTKFESSHHLCVTSDDTAEPQEYHSSGRRVDT